MTGSGSPTPSPPGPSLWQLLREDAATDRRRWASPGVQAIAVHRLGAHVYAEQSVGRRCARPLYQLLRAAVEALYAVELPPGARIGRRLHLPHPHGVVVVWGATVGDDCVLRHNTTLGAASATSPGRPVLGDRVELGPGAIVMGDVRVGDDVLIGPAAVVIEDVPAGSRVLAPVAVVRLPRTAAGTAQAL